MSTCYRFFCCAATVLTGILLLTAAAHAQAVTGFTLINADTHRPTRKMLLVW